MSVHVGHVVVGVFAIITFAVIVLFNVGFLTTHWITIQETTTTNSTDSSTPFPTTRTCHHGLFYSIDCPESDNGNSLKMHCHGSCHIIIYDYRCSISG